MGRAATGPEGGGAGWRAEFGGACPSATSRQSAPAPELSTTPRASDPGDVPRASPSRMALEC